ncbi:hypothetical protein GGS23DRAFT_582383 [Durotheca rogersii]|uniref:uncharacterized protein n=1 Tax=Durotheca rogersii TaxID=419775 RepID=UPI00221F1E9B|nr:uncharacterized protein GGS23DRAFT_582383 [Durotheca rogersii]KAI5860075.1 hypothetical protein GGS23DRAFT_582383 [Durotheca rogersii]
MATGSQAFYSLWQKEPIRERLFDLLSKEDICNVRLASSACCNLVTKRLFLRTHLTFSAHTFTRQSRIQALSRIGQHIEHLTFYFPHSDATFLPPLIHPESGREISFLYKPHTSMASVLERPKFANSGLGVVLTEQYPPLFHAASNVPSFINAMKHLPNIRHLTIKTPGQDPRERYRRDIVDYALISLRISLERAPMAKLNKLSLSSVHPSAFIYLRHVTGFGCLPSAARRWRQIRKLCVSVESWDFYGPSPGLDHLKMIDDYIRNFSENLEKLTFKWIGQRGPCPLSLAADPLFAPSRSSQKLFNEVTSPMSPLPPPPFRKPIVFRKLRYMAIRNTTMNAPQVASLVTTHQHSVREFDFENVILINEGSWDDALAPLLNRTPRGHHWTRHSTATLNGPASIHSPRLADDLSAQSPAVAAVSQELLEIDLNGGEGEGEGEDDEESDDYDLPSDLEAARKASISSQIKKRRVTKRRRKKKPRHEHHHQDERERRERQARRQHSEDSIDHPSEEPCRHNHQRHHKLEKVKEPSERRPDIYSYEHQHQQHQRQQPQHLQHLQHLLHLQHLHPLQHDHSRQPSNDSLNRPRYPPQFSPPPPPPQFSTPPPSPPRQRLFGEIDSAYSSPVPSTPPSRRLFGEVPRLGSAHNSRPGSGAGSGLGSPFGSEPELTHSPVDESDSMADEYFRPRTPQGGASPPLSLATAKSLYTDVSVRSFGTPTEPEGMHISAPLPAAESNSSMFLLEPTVYDPTAALCSEISAVQRDIEADAALRLVAEDPELQSSALRRAKELVLSRLGREFSAASTATSGSHYGSSHGSFGSFGGGWGRKGSTGGLSRKESFGGAGGFRAGVRFREGLFGRSAATSTVHSMDVPILFSRA